MHSVVHNFVGSVHGTHFNTEDGEQTSDPVFPLFHSFIEYLRLMHTDCYEFDTIPASDLDSCVPYCFDNAYGRNITLDYAMDFSALCDGNSGQQVM